MFSSTSSIYPYQINCANGFKYYLTLEGDYIKKISNLSINDDYSSYLVFNYSTINNKKLLTNIQEKKFLNNEELIR